MKMKIYCAAGLVLTLIVAICPVASAAQAGDRPARADLRERISDLYLLRMTSALELTEEQTAKLFPILTRVEKEKAGLQRQVVVDLRDLRAELAKTPPGDPAILGMVERIQKAHRVIRQKDDEVEAALESVLTPVQKGRYLIFRVEFLRNIGENLGRIRGIRGPAKRTP